MIIKVTFHYSNGVQVEKKFYSYEAMYHFAHNEGDHLVHFEYEVIQETSEK